MDSVNKWLTLAANFGVIAGIVFLGLELSQNNQLLEAQARTTRLDVRRADYLLPMTHPEYAEILVKHKNGEPLTESEDLIITRAIASSLLNLQFVYNEYRQGIIDESSIPIESWSALFLPSDPDYYNPNMRDFWDNFKYSQFNPDFIQWMDENVVNK